MFVAFALATIAIGLLVHWTSLLTGAAHDIAGDALWAMMVAWWLGAIAPATRSRVRALVALAICFAVETSQLHHSPSLDALRGTTLGHLVLGSGFDPRDFAAYAAGVAAAFLIESALRRRDVIRRRD